MLLLLITFMYRYSPLLSRLTAFVVCDFEAVTLTFYHMFLNIHRGVLKCYFSICLFHVKENKGDQWNPLSLRPPYTLSENGLRRGVVLGQGLIFMDA